VKVDRYQRRQLRKPVIAEKVEQANGVALLRSLGGRVWVLGTKRKRGDHQGTMQTAGIADVKAFLPAPRYTINTGAPHARSGPTGLWWEAKRSAGGVQSDEQKTFEKWCQFTNEAYVCGNLDALFAWLIDAGYLLEDNVPYYRRPKG